jgi:hypothetical protein
LTAAAIRRHDAAGREPLIDSAITFQLRRLTGLAKRTLGFGTEGAARAAVERRG